MMRSKKTTVAAVLSACFNLVNLVFAIPLVAQGAAGIEAGVDGPPFSIVIMAIIVSAVGLMAVWGLWNNQRWAKIVTILIMALGLLGALPGVILAVPLWLRLSAIASVIIPLIIIVLLLLPTNRPSAVKQTP